MKKKCILSSRPSKNIKIILPNEEENLNLPFIVIICIDTTWIINISWYI